MLDCLIPCDKDQKRFIDLWKEKYKKYILEKDSSEIYLWNIRTHKALKEVFASAQLFLESLVAKESKSWTSFYFSSYYSLFHAFLACVYMLPTQNIEQLSKITHSKLKNVFNDIFCTHKFKIIDESIITTFSILQYQREYYSYHMPPNQFLYEHKNNVKPDIVLPGHLRSCFQLANLLSLIVDSSFEKYHKKIVKKKVDYSFVYKNFCLVNCSKHPITDTYLLHYVDRVKLRETFEYPGPISFLIELEHFTDEFGLYDNTGFPCFANGEETSPSRLVYSSIY